LDFVTNKEHNRKEVVLAVVATKRHHGEEE